MKFGLTAVGFMGVIVIASWGLLPAPASSRFHVSEKLAFRTLESGGSTDGNQNANQCDLQQSERRDETLAGSGAEVTLRHKIDLLARGLTFLETIQDYTAELHKQEVVNGALLDEQSISIKCRHKPFNVYLLWLKGDVGREVLYIDGTNNGSMIAHSGGWKARIPAFSVSTDSRFAMRDTRYPVTTAGLRGLIEIMDAIHQNDLARQNLESCELDSQRQFDERPCDVFTTRYRSAADSPVYRKSITWIDREWNVPLQSRHFEWPTKTTSTAEEQLDEETLIESYSFTDIVFERQLTDDDFSRANPEYRFR